jgi:hypothetical protein
VHMHCWTAFARFSKSRCCTAVGAPSSC